MFAGRLSASWINHPTESNRIELNIMKMEYVQVMTVFCTSKWNSSKLFEISKQCCISVWCMQIDMECEMAVFKLKPSEKGTICFSSPGMDEYLELQNSYYHEAMLSPPFNIHPQRIKSQKLPITSCLLFVAWFVHLIAIWKLQFRRNSISPSVQCISWMLCSDKT